MSKANNTVPDYGSGYLEVSEKGFGFLRSPDNHFQPKPTDIFVTPDTIKRNFLREGCLVAGPTQPPQQPARTAPSGDHRGTLTQVRNHILIEGFKGLTLIYGGGAAALAAFLQAIWDKPNAAPMRVWLLSGVSILLLGTAISAVVFVARYLTFFDPNSAVPGRSRMWRATFVLVAVAVGCFVVGMGAAVLGAFVALCRP